MSIWDWFDERRREYREAEDRERYRMSKLSMDAREYRETDPDRALALYAEGSRLARRLREPWWVLLYDLWQVMILVHDKQDLRHVLDRVVRCVLEARKPAFAQHPWRFAALNTLIATYLTIDPLGYADAVREAMDYLEQQLPPGPTEDRLVLLGNRRELLMELEQPDDAYAEALDQLALADQNSQTLVNPHYITGTAAHLCWICQRRGDWDAVAGYAERAEELARRSGRQRLLAQALVWQAVVARRADDEVLARRRWRQAGYLLGRLRCRPSSWHFDAVSLYHELAGNRAAALRARDRQLDALADKGEFVTECKARIERCRLLAEMRRLTDADLAAARAAAGKLRAPATYLARIEQLAADRA